MGGGGGFPGTYTALASSGKTQGCRQILFADMIVSVIVHGIQISVSLKFGC